MAPEGLIRCPRGSDARQALPRDLLHDVRAEVARLGHGDGLGHQCRTLGAHAIHVQVEHAMLVEVSPAMVRVPGGAAVPGVGMARPEGQPQVASQALLPGGEDATDLHLRRVARPVVHRAVVPGVHVAAHEDEIAVSPGRAEVRDEQRESAPARVHLGAEANPHGTPAQRLTEEAATLAIDGDDGSLGEQAGVLGRGGAPDDGGDHLVHLVPTGVDLRCRPRLPDPKDLARHRMTVAQGGPAPDLVLRQRRGFGAADVPQLQDDPLRRRRGGHGVGDARNARGRVAQQFQEGCHRPARPALRPMFLDLEPPALQCAGDVPERGPLFRRSRQAHLAGEVDQHAPRGVPPRPDGSAPALPR